MSVLVSGGGLRSGIVYGETNTKGEYPIDRTCSPADVLATIAAVGTEHVTLATDFGQRINRTRLHRAIKGATLSYEDEKYSYVAVSRATRSAVSWA
mgnify:CR=1 FL=1